MLAQETEAETLSGVFPFMAIYFNTKASGSIADRPLIDTKYYQLVAKSKLPQY
jgi:hypothetical protein